MRGDELAGDRPAVGGIHGDSHEDVDADAVLRYTALARQAVSDGLIGYALIIAEKP